MCALRGWKLGKSSACSAAFLLYICSMKQRIYIDTSVIGGYYDFRV